MTPDDRKTAREHRHTADCITGCGYPKYEGSFDSEYADDVAVAEPGDKGCAVGEDKVEEMRENLNRVAEQVASWTPGKRENAEAIMYAPSLAQIHEAAAPPVPKPSGDKAECDHTPVNNGSGYEPAEERKFSCGKCGVDITQPESKAEAGELSPEWEVVRANLGNTEYARNAIERQMQHLTDDQKRTLFRSVVKSARTPEPIHQQMLEALIMARGALRNCYDVVEWPADGSTTQDAAILRIDAAISAAATGGGK